jgi:hypothetical protein
MGLAGEPPQLPDSEIRVAFERVGATCKPPPSDGFVIRRVGAQHGTVGPQLEHSLVGLPSSD